MGVCEWLRMMRRGVLVVSIVVAIVLIVVVSR